MKILNYIFLICFVALFAPAQAQNLPDVPVTIEFHHPLGYMDSVVVGFSLNAGEGYDEGLDIIDTSAMEFPISARVYDSKVRQEIGGPENYNLKHSYQQVPDTVARNEWFLTKTFYVLLKTDSLDLSDYWYEESDSIGCQDYPSVYGGLINSTYFKVRLDSVYEHLRHLSKKSYYFSDLSVQGNVYLGNAIDRTEVVFDPRHNPDNTIFCMSLNADWSSSYVNLIFDFAFRNSRYVSINEYDNQFIVSINDGTLLIDQIVPPYQIYLLSSDGRMLFEDYNNNQVIYKKNIFNSQNKLYILHIQNKDKELFLTKKIFNQ